MFLLQSPRIRAKIACRRQSLSRGAIPGTLYYAGEVQGLVKIYVGNLSYSVNEDELRTAFEPFGTVDSVDVIIDRNTGRSKGFGFVEMSNDEEAKAAIAGLNGKDLAGRSMNVNEARPRTDRPPRSNYRY